MDDPPKRAYTCRSGILPLIVGDAGAVTPVPRGSVRYGCFRGSTPLAGQGERRGGAEEIVRFPPRGAPTWATDLLRTVAGG